MSEGPDTTRRHGSTGRWEPGRPGGVASPRTISGTGLVAVGLAVVMIAIGWRGYHEPPWAFAMADLVGLSFMGAGWIAWYQTPANRIGPLMLVAGGCWYLSNLQFTGNPVLYGP